MKTSIVKGIATATLEVIGAVSKGQVPRKRCVFTTHGGPGDVIGLILTKAGLRHRFGSFRPWKGHTFPRWFDGFDALRHLASQDVQLRKIFGDNEEEFRVIMTRLELLQDGALKDSKNATKKAIEKLLYQFHGLLLDIN
jgi:hypothetical protein